MLGKPGVTFLVSTLGGHTTGRVSSNSRSGTSPLGRLFFGISLWPPYVIGGPLYFCPVISIYLSIYLLFLFLA